MTEQTSIESFTGDESSKDWEEKQFSELMQSMRNGLYKKKDFYGDGSPIVKMGELFASEFISPTEEMDRLELTDSEKEKHGLQKGDLLFARRSYVREGSGKCSIVDELSETLVPESSIIRARPDKEKVVPEYLYYYFKSDIGREEIDKIIRQTAVSGIAQSDLKDVPVLVPPLQAQRTIVERLLQIDNKIRVNNNVNELLEEMAKSVYKSRYIDFKPYNDFKDSEIGKIPDEFQVARVEEICQINPSSINDDDFKHSDIKYLDISSTGKGTIEELQEFELSEAPSRAKRTVQDGDTVISTVRPGREQYVYITDPEDNLVASTGFVVLRPKESSPLTNEFLYYSCIQPNIIKFLENNTTGSAYPAVNLDVIRDIQLPIPPQEEINDFTSKVSDSVKLRTINRRMNNTLAELRDTLLPKLMSGEIRLDPDSNNSPTNNE